MKFFVPTEKIKEMDLESIQFSQLPLKLVLLPEAGAALRSETTFQQGKRFPVAEMVRRSCFTGLIGTAAEARSQQKDLLEGFFCSLGGKALQPALNRQHVRNGSQQAPRVLAAWKIPVANIATQESLPEWRPGTVN